MAPHFKDVSIQFLFANWFFQLLKHVVMLAWFYDRNNLYYPHKFKTIPKVLKYSMRLIRLFYSKVILHLWVGYCFTKLNMLNVFLCINTLKIFYSQFDESLLGYWNLLGFSVWGVKLKTFLRRFANKSKNFKKERHGSLNF